MKLLDEYFAKEKEIHDYFGYKEDWVKIPLNDSTMYYWHLIGDGSEGYGKAKIIFQEEPLTAEQVADGDATYSSLVYPQRFLPKWVYRTKDYTLICEDTRTDGNKFLSIFDNKKEFKA